MLTDGPNPDDFLAQPHLIVSAGRGGPQQPAERENFARRMFAVPQGLTGRITAAESMRIGGQPGFEIQADATDPEIRRIVHGREWLRFGTGGYLRVVGSPTRKYGHRFSPRFRAVRDGIRAAVAVAAP